MKATKLLFEHLEKADHSDCVDMGVVISACKSDRDLQWLEMALELGMAADASNEVHVHCHMVPRSPEF